MKRKVPKANILNIFSVIMRRMIPSVHCLTSNEAENMGVFFLEWFKLMQRWAEPDAKAWNEECKDFRGFTKLVNGPESDPVID